MLVNVGFKKIAEKLNLIQIGNNFISAYFSYPIEDDKTYENIPCSNNWWSVTSICAAGFHIGNIEFKIGPSLTGQIGRYEKRYIDNKAEKLKDEYNHNEITKIAKQCTDLADYDLNNNSYGYANFFLTMAPYTAVILYTLYHGGIYTDYTVAGVMGVSIIAPAIVFSSKAIQISDADVRFDQFTILLESCADDQGCIENAYRVGLDLCSPLSETIFGHSVEGI